MRHQEAFARLPELLGLRAAQGDEATLRAHVAGCPACARRLARLRRVERALRAGALSEEPPAPLERAVLEIPGRDPRESRRAPRRRWLAGALAAAAAGLAVALGLVLAGGAEKAPAPTFAPTRTVALRGAPGLEGTLSLGRARGDVQPIRLTLRGLDHVRAGAYGLWLVGPGGSVSAAAFRPGEGGGCVIVTSVARQAWTRAVVTRDNRPPSAGTTVTSAAL